MWLIMAHTKGAILHAAGLLISTNAFIVFMTLSFIIECLLLK